MSRWPFWTSVTRGPQAPHNGSARTDDLKQDRRCNADRGLGPHRAAALAADLATVDERAAAERQAERERLQRGLADVARRRHNLRPQAQDLDRRHPDRSPPCRTPSADALRNGVHC
jgi:hypothetical protein